MRAVGIWHKRLSDNQRGKSAVVLNSNESMIGDNLYRKVASSTQTKKSRWERYKNVDAIFGIRDASLFENKKLLLVDDVITTGSTIEACASVLNQIDGVEVSVGAMASAAF